MDPTACYLIILEAFREHDYARAREYALILKTWLESGGFYPLRFNAVEVHDMLGRILRAACNAPALRFPFARIICNHCDAGSDVDTLPDAIDAGWYKIDITVDNPGVSHIGTCPDCRRKQEEDCKSFRITKCENRPQAFRGRLRLSENSRRYRAGRCHRAGLSPTSCRH